MRRWRWGKRPERPDQGEMMLRETIEGTRAEPLHRRRLVSWLVALGGAVVASAVLAGPASAAVMITADAPAFIITLTAADNVAVTCVAGDVHVNGIDQVTECADVISLTITATGAFPNTIDISGVTAAAFATPPPAPTITVNAGAGDDAITGSPLDDIALNGED